jgi:structural maintenance of chromosome 4
LKGLLKDSADKTQVFHDQIEAKQKELQPWTKKINERQAKIDVARSEHDSLVKKAQAAQAASEEAKAALEQLLNAHAAKVSQNCIPNDN